MNDELVGGDVLTLATLGDEQMTRETVDLLTGAVYDLSGGRATY